MVTVTLDKQPEIPQREVRTGAAATPEEFEAISEVRPPGERGLVTGCWEQLCPPACLHSAWPSSHVVLTQCDPAEVSGWICAPLTPAHARSRVLLSMGQSAHRDAGMVPCEINTESVHILLIAIGQSNVMPDECNPINNLVCVWGHSCFLKFVC